MLLETNSIIISDMHTNYWEKSYISPNGRIKYYTICNTVWIGTTMEKKFPIIVVIENFSPKVTLMLYDSIDSFWNKGKCKIHSQFNRDNMEDIPYEDITKNIRYLIRDYIDKCY